MKKIVYYLVITIVFLCFLILPDLKAQAASKIVATPQVKSSITKESTAEVSKPQNTKAVLKVKTAQTKEVKEKVLKGKVLKNLIVRQGDLIGYEGGMPGTCGSGLSTGAHLHFEVRRNGEAINPRDLLGNSLSWPLADFRVTQEFGPADWTPWYSFHTGIDLASNNGWGAPVYSAGNGRIILNQISGGYGHLIIIDNGGGIRTYFGHLKCV